jgi:hypothetical protein
MNTDINAEMLTEIQKQHQESKRLIAEARTRLKAATDKALVVATLVEKASRHHKNDTHGYLAPVMNGIESRAYLTAYKASKCRDISMDKRVLQKLGVMDTAPPRAKTRTTKAPPSLTTRLAKANADINKSLIARPVDAMSQTEAETLKEAMKPLAQLYVKLSNHAQ